MRTIDLRSDTVSQPTEAMRRAMAAAEVGDDCYGDDPSVLALQRQVAARIGKPAALFVPSGTMANQLAIAVHARPGETLVCAALAHLQVHEDASAARLSGVQAMPLGDCFGFDAVDLEDQIREERWGWPRVGLVCMENTLGIAGGVVWPQQRLTEIAALARAAGRPIHLDGARLWNAHIATGVALPELASVADSVSVCLSKGLGCPAGSVLCGSEAFIARARALRHGFGGALRQAGVLAAAGLYALEHNIERLRVDHQRARRLAVELGELPCWSAREPQTNMVIFDLPDRRDAELLCAPLREAGVHCYPNRFSEIRLVLHLGLQDEDITSVIERVRATLGQQG